MNNSDNPEFGPEKGRINTDRRRFLGATASALAAAPVLATTSTAAAENGYDTIVIGGGFAGVTAAREASLRGLRTLLLEARPRLGGRTFTMPLADHDIDLGGTWVGWSQPHVWSEIMRYNLPIDESAAAVAEHAVWMDAGRRVEGSYDDYAAILERATDAFYKPARGAFPRPFDPRFTTDFDDLDNIDAASAIKAMKLLPLERDLALSTAAINAHSPPGDSSFLDQQRWMALSDFDVWNMWDNIARYRVRGGTGRLLERMHNDGRAETQLGVAVKSVHQNEDGVTVTSTDGTTYRARSAIVAVPLNCLVDIDFQPALSEAKQRVSRARHTGSGTKLYAKIRGKRPLVFAHGTHDMPLCFLWTEYNDSDSQVLVGFGASYDLLDVNSDEAVANALRAFLPDVEMEEFFTYDWNVDPYSRGTWCMYPPNVLSRDFNDLKAHEGRVLFAGADIANGWRGFIDGAIESGLRVGREAGDRFRPGA